MNKKNIYYSIAGIINLFTFFLHVIAGQSSLINPLLKSDLSSQIETELLGVWHMATVILLASSILYIKHGISKGIRENIELITFISYLYIGFALAFIFASLFNSILASQWILLLPIGVFGFLGTKKSKKEYKPY